MGLPSLSAEAYARVLQKLLPPGKLWNLEEGSTLRSALLGSGDELARINEAAALLVEEADPRTTVDLLEDFERVLGLSSEGTTAARQARVTSHLAAIRGAKPSDMASSLAPIFDLDEVDVEILENSNRFVDTFGDASISVAWSQKPGCGEIVESGGVLTLLVESGNTPGFLDGDDGGPMLLSPISAPGEVDVIAHLSNISLPTNGLRTALILQSSLNGPSIHVGLARDSGSLKLFRYSSLSGETIGATTVASSLWFRIKRNANGTLNLYYIETSTPETASWTSLASNLTSIGTPQKCGLVLYNNNSSLGSDNFAGWSEFRKHQPESRNVFRWFAYRDPNLAGSPSMSDAQDLIDKIAPAHTRAIACQSKALECGVPSSLVGRDPLGGVPGW